MILMAQLKGHFLVPILLVMLLAVDGARTPPGIAKNPSNARCLDNNYKTCYNLVHVCPKFCPDSCTVNCRSCKPVCGASSPSPPTTTPSPPPPYYSPPPTTPTPSPPLPTPTPSTPSPLPPTPTPSTPSTPPPPPTPTPSAPPPTSTPSMPSPPPPASPPPTPTPSPPPPTTPSTPSPPPPASTPSTPSPPPPTSTPSIPSPPPSTPPPPTSTTTTPSPTPPTTPSPHTWTPPSTSPKTTKCKNKNYPLCYNIEYSCPSACPGGCEVDCVTCKPVCSCDKPGAICQDPRFIGGDGITFYFHGKKDKDFCLVSDSNLHINAHFIGRRNENMKRDFTWVESIAIFFDKHRLFLGALKTSTWDDSIDRLALDFDGQPITLPATDDSTWSSNNVSITRVGDTNNVIVELKRKFRIKAKVVPITQQDSRIHNYGITNEDCFAHLDLGFKFYSLSDQVNGVLGQTYRPGYVTRVNMGATMPVMGGDGDFATSSLFALDCDVARFSGNNGFDDEGSIKGFDLPNLSCASGIDGQGVVCKR